MKRRLRRMTFESLERRYVLAFDVDANGLLNALDALSIANAINTSSNSADVRMDVTGDGTIDLADFNAVIRAINLDVQRAAEMAEAEGEQDIPIISVMHGHPGLAEEGEFKSYLAFHRTGDVSEALTVTLSVSGTFPNPAQPGSDFTAPTTVTFEAGNATATIEIKPFDDTEVEENETFRISIPRPTTPFGVPRPYDVDPTAWFEDFKIMDDEWRWIKPDGPDDDGWWDWLDADGQEINRTVQRTLLPDGTLSPRGFIHTPSYNVVAADMHAGLYFPIDYHYAVDLESSFGFDGDSQTGQVWLSGSLSSPPTGPQANGPLAGAMGYSWSIEDDTDTDTHVVNVSITFGALAGGTYGWSTTVGAEGKSKSASFTINFEESWKREEVGGAFVTLFFRKGGAE